MSAYGTLLPSARAIGCPVAAKADIALILLHSLSDEAAPMPVQAAQRVKRASTERDEQVAAPGLLVRVIARLRGQ